MIRILSISLVLAFAVVGNGRAQVNPTSAEPAPMQVARVTVTPELPATNAPARPSEPARPNEPAAPAVAFSSITKTDTVYTAALDAHDLEGTYKLVGQEGAFKGTVSGIYEPRGKLKILNFDPQYRTAVTAVLHGEDAEKFPDIKLLVGKEVVVTGTFTNYRERAEIMLTKPDQIKLVQ